MVDIIRTELSNMQDIKYKDFHSKLIPTVDPDTVIGVRMPQMKAYAKSLKNTDVSAFLSDLPHKYYDENNLHGLLIMNIKDYREGLAAVKAFLPYVDNWATCDLLRPVSFKKHKAELLEEIKHWLKSEHTYTIRFGIEMLMVHFLDEDFRPEYLEWLAEIRSEEYYVNMMLAWYFATALAKQWDAAVQYIENRRLDKWVHNKSIQKAIESYRVTEEQKAYLRTLKIKH
ncbi:MAG: DNA alkylation repair protein [Oscillospiraceae bacterium]|nr:DNA alkylation repair protein [Oscillospiraceae bacterium]